MKQKFLHLFPNVPIPVNSTIMRLIDKFRDTGNVADEQWLGRKKSVTMRESMDHVQAVVSQHLHNTQTDGTLWGKS